MNIIPINDGADGFQVEGRPLVFSEIRGAVIGPTQESVGYFCIFGKTLSKDDRTYELVMLYEEETGASLKLLVESLITAAYTSFCHTVYVDRLQEGFVYALAKARRDQGFPLTISAVPLDSIQDMVPKVHDAIMMGRIKVPVRSILASQIVNVRKTDADALYFYAYRALCFIVSGFYVQRNSSMLEKYKADRRKAEYDKQFQQLNGISRVATLEIQNLWDEIKALEDSYKYLDE